jgi:alkanesulfonate monooxygenase SsuD/methylene tetrahydromethanopterin reductase-like flavin-dependent oxidoreductase (luciferase family)
MMEGYWAHAAKRGKSDNPHRAAFFQQICVSDTDTACEKEWWPHVDYFFNKCLHLYPGTSGAPGYMSEASLRAGIVAQVGNTSQNMGMNKTWKQLCEERYIVAGSPATVRQQLEELAKSLHVAHLVIGAHIGSAPIELTNRSSYLFATQVMSHLRPIFAEHPDIVWPKALPASARIAAGAQNDAVRSRAERKVGAAA